ncbi:MAG: dimethylarginine dimethylaminohydrolase family protein, partial [Nitrospinota bacterium]
MDNEANKKEPHWKLNSYTMEPAQTYTFLMCRPDHFGVKYVINPWMKGNVGRSNNSVAVRQWENLFKILSGVAVVKLIDPVENLPDMVFTANAGIVSEKKAVLSHFRYPERQPEEKFFEQWFHRQGFEICKISPRFLFEGAGDALFDCEGNRLFCAYGSRTSL